jgi:hypothetical protein
LVGSPTTQAVDGGGFLVAGDEQADRAAESLPARRQKPRHRGRETGDRAFHVGGAAADEDAVPSRGGEGVGRPAGKIARRHHVGMAGEAEIAPSLAEPRIEVQHLVGAGLGEFDGLADKTQPFERAREKRDRARILGRDARETDQLRREMHGIDGDHGFSRHQSRSNSLIEVLARVRASTRLTMTQQARLGPLPSLAGRLPGTTTA